MSKRAGHFKGYELSSATPPPEVTELTRVGRRTPCGEYLRRFWHPIALTGELGAEPIPLEVLDEPLVAFRLPDGEPGLLHRHCVHRGTSLTLARVEAEGLRCCHHGWLYARDGTLLETPMEPAASRIRQTVRLGAYPVEERYGLVFAYLGPPALRPTLPRFDSLELPGSAYKARRHVIDVNWFQLAETRLDPANAVHVETDLDGTQRHHAQWRLVPQTDFHEVENGYRCTYARRLGEHIWIGLAELVLPNFFQTGDPGAIDGLAPRRYRRGRGGLWLVPMSAERTQLVSLTRADADEASESVETAPPPRTRPSLADVAASQGTPYLRTNEHLGYGDRGVVGLRQGLRRVIRAAAELEPPGPLGGNAAVPTCAGDVLLRIAKRADDARRMTEAARAVIGIFNQADRVPGPQRDRHIETQLHTLEKNYRLR